MRATGQHNTISAARLWMVLARASSSIGTYIERSMTEQGFCLSDFMVLEVLLHKGPLTISAIGGKVLLASASMTSAIDRLEERGLVLRLSRAEDRRVRLVQLTPCGRSLIERLFARHAEELEALSKDISQRERKLLYEALKRVGKAAKEATPLVGSTNPST